MRGEQKGQEEAIITLIRIGPIAPGKTGEAMTLIHQIAKLVADKTRTNITVSVPVGGNPARIATMSSYESLAAFESISVKLLADADYRKLIESAGPCFLSGSMHDELWSSV